jgi:ParB family transcriptional regulator, chromosome partitioning protein
MGPKEDEELQRQIEANEGLFEPVLVEPHPDIPGKFRIIDGDRRWTNSMALVQRGKDEFRAIPVEITDRTLSDEERLRVWIYIHRQRKEWDAREKEMVAFGLGELVGRASAANILGITVRELDRLIEIFQLSSRFTNLREPGAAITWARELMGVSKSLLTPTVLDSVVAKVNEKRITNSKDLRKLRRILRDPVAKDHFLARDGDIESSLILVSPNESRSSPVGISSDLNSAVESMKHLPWTAVEELRGDADILSKLDEAQALITRLKRILSAEPD